MRATRKAAVFILLLAMALASLPAPARAMPDNFSATLVTGGRLYYTYLDNGETMRGFVKFPAASAEANLVEIYLYQAGDYRFWASWWLDPGEIIPEVFNAPRLAYLGPGRVNVASMAGKTALLRRLYLPEVER